MATSHGVTPDDVHFRWSPTHQDLEVISKNSLPIYLYAPGENKPRLFSPSPCLLSILHPLLLTWLLFSIAISSSFPCFLPTFPLPDQVFPLLSLLQLLTWGTSC